MVVVTSAAKRCCLGHAVDSGVIGRAGALVGHSSIIAALPGDAHSLHQSRVERRRSSPSRTRSFTCLSARYDRPMSDEPRDNSGDPARNPRGEQATGDLASALGALFAEQLPNAQRSLDELASEHPDLDDQAKIRRVKARAARRIASTLRNDDAEQLREAVAELAVAIVLIRRFEPRTKAEFAELGARVMASAEKTANRHQRVGGAVPHAVSGIERVARQIQPIVAEQLFRALGGAKPKRPGVARDAYKSMRSTVWRARHNREITAATASTAAAAVARAVDAAAPRLIVRMVDRSLRPKRGDNVKPN